MNSLCFPNYENTRNKAIRGTWSGLSVCHPVARLENAGKAFLSGSKLRAGRAGFPPNPFLYFLEHFLLKLKMPKKSRLDFL